MIWLIILTFFPKIWPSPSAEVPQNARDFHFVPTIDTLKYDDGTPEGFYIVGDYKNDKLGVKFEYPHKHYKVLGVLVFANTIDGFIDACLCPDNNGLPDTLNPLAQIDSIYSATKDWMFTPIEAEINDTIPLWFILRMSANPGIGGDTNNPNGHSWYYSDIRGWEPSKYNWLIRLVVEWKTEYYEDFADSNGGYTGNWEFGVPSIIEPCGDNCFGTKLNTLYPHNAYLQLESPWIPVKNYGFQDPMLSFRHFYKTQYEADGGNVKISQDSLNWILINPLREGGYDIVLSGACEIDGELGFSGKSDGWRKEYFLLPQWDSLKVRWCFGSDEAANDLGWFVDEIKIGERLSDNDVSPVSINFGRIIPPETTLIPEVKIRNTGISSTGIFSVECVIESCGVIIYQDNQPMGSLAPDSIATVNFTTWNTGPKNVTYDIKTYTDNDQTNDTLKVTTLAFPLITELTAGFTETPPLIDGIIDSIEWKDATQIDGSDILGIDSEDLPESCNLYFMNSHSTLYIGCKAESLSEIRLYIDDSGNKEWEHNGSEGFYWITPDKYGFQDMYYHFVHSLPDSLKSIGPEGVELGIPIGREPYEITPTCSLGCFISANSPTGYVGWWHQAIINYNNPANYAKVKLIGVGVEERIPNPESRTTKLEVSPNPFISFTTIKYCLPTKAKVSLKIYDITGRAVKTLISEEKDAGTYNISFDTKGLSTGIYFTKFTTDDYKETKKLILIR